ncbi:S9 family peptidase [Sporosarcina oncorhynchi]|uniref:S9 family peptidase n=1 Tax=Sporosarcina oncorhynchi TaxID=3056444 RepID=A0ABZ0L4H6_9BACL|nr:S9 family peptidase [Sporosarcina sp. T2O-4]WOV87065.1 S9 family peptidase [Sporosarcina sp. T2O-4]
MINVMRKHSIEQFVNCERLVGVSISSDDKRVLVGSDRSGVYNAYSVSLADGETVQLTHSQDNLMIPIGYFPDGRKFLYRSDQGGNELTHLYMQSENGKSVDLTPGKEEKAEFHRWSRDDKYFFYESNKRDSRYMDLYEMDIDTLESTLLFKNEDGYMVAAISDDKKYIALLKPRTSNDSDMFIYTEEEGVKHLSEHIGDEQYQPIAFDADSTCIYYLTDKDHEFLYLSRLCLSTGSSEIVAKEEWDILTARFSPNYKYLYYYINNDGKVEVKVIDSKTGKNVEIMDFPQGQISGLSISKGERYMAFLLNRSTAPANLYVYDFELKELRCLTDTLNAEIDEHDLVDARVIHYSSFDGLEIPAIYYEPRLEEGEKAPALIWVHGGPGGQSTVDFSPLFQYLVNHGYAVLAVNNRGSSGYGKSFFKAADLKHGDVDLADCIEGKKFLIGTGRIEEDRIGIIGGSYGGYMTLAALAFQPDAFKVGVNIFGVSNWERTLKSIPPWWEAMRELLYKKIGDPYEQTDYIRSISPLFHADKINKPLIVLQGANDPRVLQVESDDIVEKVKENGVPVEYIVFEDEGHGFTKRENQITGYGAIREFLDTHL